MMRVKLIRSCSLLALFCLDENLILTNGEKQSSPI